MNLQAPSTCIHHLFEAQVRRNPTAVAVCFGPRHLSYAELDMRAERLAAELRARGVGPDVLVGVCVERSPEMVIALLGVLKAGGAYVPLDPAFPPDRLAYMLEDSGTPVLLTQSWLVPSLPEHRAEVLCLDSVPVPVPDENRERERERDSATDLAYVIYTSGSTGRPKGVMIPHAAVVNLLESMRRQPGMTVNDTLVAVTTLSFDIAALELFLPLTCGGRLVVASRERATNPDYLTDLADRSRATVMQATPATWRLLLNLGWTGKKNLKILCGGEALPRPLAEQLLPRCAELWNVYGPTETTIWSTLQRVSVGVGPVPIGRPVAATTLYVLGSDLKPVPTGEVGELYIGGAGLARGYLGRPDLTAERFLPDPLAAEPGARMYRSGDLARFLPDGTMECLGRVDHQVKVRGYRIELGEIEAALIRHPEVREAAVVAREDGSGEKGLVAYVVPQPGKAPAAEDLRNTLRERLPEYMVPATFVSLAALPLTPNGKINRLALPAPGGRAGSAKAASPHDSLEAKLVGVWERVLGIQPIGVRDNVFDLGVSSIVAARLLAEIERAVGQRLPPTPLFQAPTIAQLAALLREGSAVSKRSSLVAIRKEGTRPPLFCVHGGAGTILFYHPLVRHLAPGRPVYGLQMRGLYGGAPPHTSVVAMASAYVRQIQALFPTGPYHLAGYCFGSIVAYEMAQQLRRAGHRVGVLAAFNGPSPAYIRRRNQLEAQDRPPRIAPPRVGFFRKVVRGLVWRARAFRRRLNLGFRVRRLLPLPIPERLRDNWFRILNNLAELRYEPAPWEGPMFVFHSRDFYTDPLLGWGEVVRGGVRDYEVPGAHDTERLLMLEPSVCLVAARLDEWLTEMESGAAKVPPRAETNLIIAQGS
jgi:amino acid adenylation domain-containing protein